ncbi:MAG: hypothetical protein LBT41_04205 [Candidatus Methanoplasma sp.]|jgi:DMSO/TMAO reductase YedYZ heme-binding membrane subunit|nr:hypothetical protein [Candidatus Methanoplasma sp.]
MIRFITSIAIALAITALFVLFHKQVHKRSHLIYIAAAVITAYIIGAGMMHATGSWPQWFSTNIASTINQGALAVAVFVMVMYVGVLPKKWRLTRRLIYVRAELSIIGCILSLGHNANYANLFVQLFTDPMSMRGNGLYAVASIDSLILIALMIPLMITSFYSVRKLFTAKKWKSLQKWSYVFYVGLYVHAALIFWTAISGGHHAAASTDSLIAYSIFFIPYFVLRPLKYLLDKRAHAPVGEEGLI